MTQWQNQPVSVPYGNLNYDLAQGGSHDMDLKEPVDTPISFLRAGKIVDISSPPWGKQVGVQLDSPINGVPYYAFLHLDAVNPALAVGEHVNPGDLVGWSGGANSWDQVAGASNPTGSHYLNPAIQSSQPQIGLALMYGPRYGYGSGWISHPEQHPELNPEQLFSATNTTTSSSTTPLDLWSSIGSFFSGLAGTSLPSVSNQFLVRAGLVIGGSALILIGAFGLVKQSNIPQTVEKTAQVAAVAGA